MNLDAWAWKWAIDPRALNELRGLLLGVEPPPAPADPGDMSEAGVQAKVRVAAAKRGWRLWRNNVGAYHDAERGIHLRYGLCNDSPQMNAVLKSADLIGIIPRVIQPQDVGKLIGQFASIECKHAGWKPRPNDQHEQAQSAWAALVTALGGEARFVSSDKQL